MNRCYLFFIFLLSFSASAQLDFEYHTSFGTDEGLEIDIIQTMEFDDDGFLWIGGQNLDTRAIISSKTSLAIQRFNGRYFHTFPFPESHNDASLVEHIYKRDDGKLYIKYKSQHNGGFLLFDPILAKYQSINLPGDTNSLYGSSNIYSYNDKDYLLIQAGNIITLFTINNQLEFSKVVSFVIPIEKKYLIDTSTVFIPFKDHFIISDDNFYMYAVNWKGEILHQLKEGVDGFFIDEYFIQDDIFYFFPYENAQLYKLDEKKLQAIPVNGTKTTLESNHLSVIQSAENNLILSNVDGELIFGTFSEEKIKTYTTSNFFKSTTSLKTASQNISKDLWIGTNTKELHYFKFSDTKVENYLNDKSIRFIKQETDSTFLITTERSGWYTFNSNTKRVQRYLDAAGNAVTKYGSNRNVLDMNNTLWTNGYSGMVSLQKHNSQSTYSKHYPIICLEQLNDSTIVYGTNGYNLMSFNSKTNEHKQLVNTDSLYIYDIAIQDDFLLGATNRGVLTYDFSTEKSAFFNDFESLYGDPFFLMADYIEDYGFVLGSRGGNILKYQETGSFERIYKDDFGAGIATILPSKKSWWINTFNGFVDFNLEDKTNIRYSQTDGFSNNEANRYSALRTNDYMLVGTIEGLNYFNPTELKKEPIQTKLVLLSQTSYNTQAEKLVTTFDREIFRKSNKIDLPAEQKDLTLDFSLTNMVRQNDADYYYRFNNDPWISLNKQQRIRFPNLAPGKYMLQVEARDFSNNRMAPSLDITINSKQFFYRTWWFIALVTIFGFLLMLYLLQQARNKTKMQQEFSEGLLQSQELERTRIGKELHDSVGQQLTIIKRKSQDLEQDVLSSMTNEALEEVRSISRNLYPVVLKQLGFSDSIEQFIFDLDDKTTLFITAEIDTVDTYFSEIETLSLYRFVQEAFANIIKHAQATVASIRIMDDNRSVHIEIQDNGIGFVVSEKLLNKSLGLQTLHERIRILDGKLNVDSTLGKGTVLHVTIPK